MSVGEKSRSIRGEVSEIACASQEEEAKYLTAAQEPLASIATVLAETGLRPDECYQLRWEHISFEEMPRYTYGCLFVSHGKTKAARRKLPLTPRVRLVLENLWTVANRPEIGWVFPAKTKTGHADHATVRKQHVRALKISGVRPFLFHSLRHTFLTRLGASGCDAWTLARIAGHSSIQMSVKYVHPSEDAVLTAMARLPESRTLQD